MSKNTPGAFSSHDDAAQFDELSTDLAAAIDHRIETKVQERTKHLEQQINELEETVEELKDQDDTTDEPDEEIATDGGNHTVELEIRTEDPDNYNLEDIWLDDIPLGNILESSLSRSKKNENRIEETKESTESHKKAIRYLNSVVGSDSFDVNGGNNQRTTVQRRETDLERLLDDPQSSGIRITESVSRALSIAAHFKRWSKSVKAGRTITKDMKKMVNTAVNANLSWKQVHRACYKLEELTNGKIEFRKTNKHGRVLVMEDKDWLTYVVSKTQGG